MESVKTFKEHFQTDSKLLWAAILVLGILGGNYDRVIDAVMPQLDERFVTQKEFDEFKAEFDNTNLKVE